jgi:hypothetical protein
LEVTVAFVGFFFAFLIVRMPWVWRVVECSLELVALFGSVVALQVPRALLFQQVFEAVGGLLQVVFRRALDSRDCVVWLALAIRTRVVVVVTALISVVVIAAARILLSLAANGVVLSVRLSSSSAHEVIMSLSLVMELGRRRLSVRNMVPTLTSR